MSSDYITRLRHELVEAAAREHAGRARRSLPPLPRLRRVVPALGAAIVAAVIVVAVATVIGGEGPNDRPVATNEVTYQAGGDADRAAEVLLARAHAVGLADVAVKASADGRVVVDLGADAHPGARETVAALSVPGRLRIYDWEKNLLTREPLSRERAAQRAEAAKGSAIAIRAVPPAADGWFVLDDDPALGNAQIARAETMAEAGMQGSGIGIRFTERGKAAFEQLTREVADRGADRALPGVDPIEASGHIAIVLDDTLVALPYINYREAPDGIDGSAGTQISGDFTRRQAERMAAIIDSGPLPGALTELPG
jgi:preprotein translocase subunit SecD